MEAVSAPCSTETDRSPVSTPPQARLAGEHSVLTPTHSAPLTRAQASAAASSHLQGTNGEAQLLASESRCSTGLSFLRDYQEDGQINIGPSHQATLPACNPKEWQLRDRQLEATGRAQSICLWKPPPPEIGISEGDVQEFCEAARSYRNFNMEQALGLLHRNNYDVEQAMNDLANYETLPETWSKSDGILFEQAYSFNGKNFRRIKQMMPEKSIADLVQYYYSQKKKRQRQSSYAEYVYKKRKSTWQEKGDAAKSVEDEEGSSIPALTPCNNCHTACAELLETPKGRVCAACFIYWRRNGGMRNISDVVASTNRNMSQKEDADDAPGSAVRQRQILRPPSDLILDIIQFVDAAGEPSALLETERQAKLRKLEEEIMQTKAKAHENKAVIASVGPPVVLRQGTPLEMFDLSYLKVPSSQFKNRGSRMWSAYETLLALQGFRRYGKDFAAISDVIATKTESQLRSFYERHKEKYKLDELIKEFENEKAEVASGRRKRGAPEIIDLESNPL